MGGLKKETLQFLKDLKKNNNREWFTKYKSRYENAYADWLGFTGELITGLSKIDKKIAAAKFQPKDCTFRIYRDIRFSKDKTPYKINFASEFSTKQGQWDVPGYYVHINTADGFMGGGAYMLQPMQLQAMREELSLNGNKFKKIIADKNFKKYFTLEGVKLVNVPRGFEKNDPMAEYLKHKHMLAMHKVAEKDILSHGFAQHCLEAFKAMQPFLHYIERPVTNP